MAPPSPTTQNPKILIVGAGFGGMATALNLDKAKANVTLVSRRNFHLFTPLLYQTATGLVDVDHLAQTVRPQARSHNFNFLEGDVLSVDLDAKKVRADFGELAYDYLVLAPGSTNNYFGIKGAAEHTLSLKTINDGQLMHNKIVGAMEKAAEEKAEASRRALLTFVVIGGGSTGVELVGSIRDFVKLMRKDYPEIKDKPRIIIVEALSSLLPGLSDYIIKQTTRILTERGVEIRTSSKVTEVSEQGVLLETGELIESANVFWTAGVKPVPLIESLNFEREKRRVKVDNFLRVNGRTETFALGDIACIFDRDSSKMLPETAQVAFQEGKWLGKTLPDLIAGEEATPFVYHHRGFMLSLGRNVGVADLGWLKTSGFFGWLIYRVVHLSQISASRNRLGVIFDWTLAYFNKRNVAHTEI